MDFIHLEASGGLVLMFTALLALIANNSLLASGYSGILDMTVTVQFGAFIISKPFLLWINDGLMAIFFFLVGLEIKREVLDGELSSLDKAALPIFAAIGGILAEHVFCDHGHGHAHSHSRENEPLAYFCSISAVILVAVFYSVIRKYKKNIFSGKVAE